MMIILDPILQLLWMLLDSSITPLEILLQINLIFGVLYLPWQYLRLRNLLSSALQGEINPRLQTTLSRNTLMKGLQKSIQLKNKTSNSQAWGGLFGIIWMTSYWATLLPAWVYLIILKL